MNISDSRIQDILFLVYIEYYLYQVQETGECE